jgi:hypothetical protein
MARRQQPVLESLQGRTSRGVFFTPAPKLGATGRNKGGRPSSCTEFKGIGNMPACRGGTVTADYLQSARNAGFGEPLGRRSANRNQGARRPSICAASAVQQEKRELQRIDLPIGRLEKRGRRYPSIVEYLGHAMRGPMMARGDFADEVGVILTQLYMLQQRELRAAGRGPFQPCERVRLLGMNVAEHLEQGRSFLVTAGFRVSTPVTLGDQVLPLDGLLADEMPPG